MPIIKRDAVRLEERPAARRAPADPAARCEPTGGARLLRADGVVRAIEVTCSCGEVTVLELSYDDGEAAAPARPEPPANPETEA